MLKVLEIAEAQVGYLEKASNRDLDSKTANAGYNNYTKYARDLDNIKNFYNGKKQGYPWCECFVDWCFVQAYGVDMALQLLCQPRGGAGAGCTQSAGYYKAKGQLFKTPEVGDQIFFTWGGDVEHTGLVYRVSGNYVYTIEGNTNGKNELVPNGGGVYKKSYLISSSIIYGYGRPNYKLVENGAKEPAPSTPTTTPTTKPTTSKGDEVEVTLSMLQKGSSGEQVKTLQALLIKKFNISCGSWGMDGDFGGSTDSAVRKFQTLKKIGVDGIVGPTTWNALLK